MQNLYEVSKTCVLANNNLCEKLYSSLELPITFDERFKFTSVPFFIHDFDLLSCKLDSFTFKVLYWLIDKAIKWVEKKLLLSNIGLFFSAREKVPNNFRNRLVPLKNLEYEPESEPKPELEPEPKHRKSALKLREYLNEEWMNEFWNKMKKRLEII